LADHFWAGIRKSEEQTLEEGINFKPGTIKVQKEEMSEPRQNETSKVHNKRKDKVKEKR
jgi:hypothetical protein